MPPTSSPIVDVFRQYARLYELRNRGHGGLDPSLENEWKQLTFTIDSIFSGMYRPGSDDRKPSSLGREHLKNQLPLEYLRVPTETDVLCETAQSFFAGRLQDISTGGAYVHAAVPLEPESRVRLTFCTLRDPMPLELEGRVAWNNPAGMKKPALPAGAGVQFLPCDEGARRRLQDFVYELVEDTLTRAHLI